MKLAHNLIALAFATGCIGLWLVMHVMEMLHRAYPFPAINAGGGKLAHGSLEIFCATHSSWLPYLGVPAIVCAFIGSLRGRSSVESLCAFAALLALIFALLFFTVTVASLASWIPLYD